MLKQRRASEAGHKRKFLVVIDDTPECDRAVVYAARRAERTGGGLVMLYVIGQANFQHWLGVEQIMRAEAQDEAESRLQHFVDRIRSFAPHIEPERVIREGTRAQEVMDLIETDEDIAILVLASSTNNDGPGPLVSAITGKSANRYPIPVTIVPGDLEDGAIEAIA